jgi:hypothetical protein
VLGVAVSVKVPRDYVGLDAGDVHLAHVLSIRGSGCKVAVAALVKVLQINESINKINQSKTVHIHAPCAASPAL